MFRVWRRPWGLARVWPDEEPQGWYLGLRHSEAGADLSLQQWDEPAGLLLLGAIAHQKLHVPCVWSRTVKYLKRKKSIMVTPMSNLKLQILRKHVPGHLPSPSPSDTLLEALPLPRDVQEHKHSEYSISESKTPGHGPPLLKGDWH